MKMFPSRHMMDYMTEINRLFPKTTENNDSLQSPSLFSTTTTTHSPPNQYGVPNRSSSSDSTSPDTFPEITAFASTPEFKFSNPSSPHSSASDTPIGVKRRPIIGRKILATPEQVTHIPPMHSSPITMQSPMKQWDFQTESTPPFQAYVPSSLEQKNYTQRAYYELFPNENRFDFKTPVKVSRNVNSVSPVSRDDPRASISRGNVNRSPSIASTSSQEASWKMCTFCRKNGETPMVYMTHKVKERVGSDFVVTCPILRSHVCPTCGGTGDNAHTITYCPVLRHRNHGLPLQSTTITLKNTRVKSNGRKRF